MSLSDRFFNPPPGPKCPQALSDAIFAQRPSECSLESGYSFWVIQAPPTNDQMTGICQSPPCKKVMDAMRGVVANECVMREGWYLFGEILNPITKHCAELPTLPPTTAAPVVTGEAPIIVNWTVSTQAPTSAQDSPSTPSGATPSPWRTVATSPPTSVDNSSSWGSGHDFPYVWLFVGFASFVVLAAFVRWCSQSRKRGTYVQREQHLVYGHVGDFDTVAPSSTVYTAIEVSGVKSPVRAAPSAPTKSKSKSVNVHNEIHRPDEEIAPKDRAAVDLDAQRHPLLQDEQITAVRVPFDKIKIGACINRGGYGEVYNGTYKDEVVAIKKMLPQHRQDVRLINSFLGEVKLMASLEHERIVKFVGVAWTSPSDICVLAEFMHGGDLRTWLKQLDALRRPIGFDTVKLQIALHVAHALTYMHSLETPVLHRDLKSGNVLLTEDLDAKVTDFGVSRERIDATMTRGVGTTLWMAPEIMMGGRYNEKADVFSFGVVLSELDSNKPPYASQLDESKNAYNTVAVMQNIQQGRMTVEFSYESDPEIVALGRDCVALDPNDRPTAAEALHRVHQVLRYYS